MATELQEYLTRFIDESDKVDKEEIWNISFDVKDLEHIDTFQDKETGVQSEFHIFNVDFKSLIWFFGRIDDDDSILKQFIQADFNNAPKAWYDKVFKFAAYHYVGLVTGVGDYLAKHMKEFYGKDSCDLKNCTKHTKKS